MIELEENESVIKKKQAFEQQLELIGTKYERWFSGRIHPFTGDTDRVHNYFRYINSTDGSTKLYLKDGLPIEIGKDCRQAFTATFEN